MGPVNEQPPTPPAGHLPAEPTGPKQERSRATRRRLLESAVHCLAHYGWTGSTVGVVAEHAGVTRGAAQHHFPTREDLFTAAVEHVAEQRSRLLAALPAPTGERPHATVALLVELYTGTLFRAALHLWVAASHEPHLGTRVAELEARIGRETHRMAVRLLNADEARPGVRETVQGLLDMARGLGLAQLLSDDSARRARVVRQWSTLVSEALHPAPADPGTHRPPAADPHQPTVDPHRSAGGRPGRTPADRNGADGQEPAR